MKRTLIVIFLIVFNFTKVFAITYNEAKLQNKPIVILFKKNGCPYCSDYEPYFNDIKAKYSYKFNFVKEEYSPNSELLKTLNVKGFPAVFLIIHQYNRAYPIQDRWNLDKTLKEYNPY